jgi:hypothetical protein
VVGGCTPPLCIVEKKSRKVVGKLWLGFKDLTWLTTQIDEAVSWCNSKNFFKNHWDGYKGLHVSLCTNSYGSFWRFQNSIVGLARVSFVYPKVRP